MELKVRFELDKEAMAKTIRDYTNNNYIISYCNKFKGLTYPGDEGLIKLLVPRLLSWYDEGHIDNIIASEYVLCKQAHIQTYENLKAFIEELEIEYTKPEKTALREKSDDEENPFVRAQKYINA